MITRKTSLGGLSVLAAVALTFVGCEDKNFQERTYTANVPIYLEHEEFRSAVASAETQPIDKAGKIFFKDHFLFINNREEGIHIVDNRDPSNPVNAGYIKVPGNREIAINEDMLYADSYVDLVAIDIRDPYNVTEVGRAKDAFPQSLPSHDPTYRVQQPDPEKGVVVGWKLETITEVVENGDVMDGFVDLRWDNNMFIEEQDERFDEQMRFGVEGGTTRNASSGGKSGSMAGFVIAHGHLYTINGSEIDVFDISNPTPVKVNSVQSDRQLETLHPFGENLFVGTTNGMLIYSLGNPQNPHYESVFEHAQSCDPVAVDETHAYVTLRSGRFCGGWSDQLDVIDITDIKFPKHVSTEFIDSPYGLAVDGNNVFVCNGSSGLTVFDASNKSSLQEVERFRDQSALDVITYNDVLMMIGPDGLYQYDFADLQNMQLLSSIKTTK